MVLSSGNGFGYLFIYSYLYIYWDFSLGIITKFWAIFYLQGVLGIKVKIMLPWDPQGKTGPKKSLPDHVSIVEPKEDSLPTQPTSEQKGGKPEVEQQPVAAMM